MLTVEWGRARRPLLGPPTRRVERSRSRADLVAVAAALIALISLGLLNLRALARSLADHQVVVVVAGALLFLLVQRLRGANLIC